MKTIAVIFGGRSPEHDISIVTAISSVIKPLKQLNQYNVLPVYITKQGEWYADKKLGEISIYSSGAIDAYIRTHRPAKISISDGFSILQATRLKTVEQKIDIVFPATHGTYGEDGSLMGLLRMANVTYVGCDMESSVIAMNKLLAHQVIAASGEKSHSYKGLSRKEFRQSTNNAGSFIKGLSYPLFVKPVHLGSSIGISRVKDSAELKDALELAFSFDSTVIIEEEVSNLIEVTVPVLGNTENLRVGLVERPLTQDSGTFDFDTKYMKQGKSGKSGKSSGAQGYSELPAKIPKELYKNCEDLAMRVFSALGCSGIARVDLLINSETGDIYFNEINPLPGSLYAHNWRAAGVSTVELVSQLIEIAEDRLRSEQELTTHFESNFLKQF